MLSMSLKITVSAAPDFVTNVSVSTGRYLLINMTIKLTQSIEYIGYIIRDNIRCQLEVHLGARLCKKKGDAIRNVYKITFLSSRLRVGIPQTLL